MMQTDEMDFASMGERKRAIFCVIPVNDGSMNYLVSMLLTQCFQQLYLRADERYNGRLPVPVRVIQDEWANVAQPDSYPKVLATCRSYNIGINIIVQNIQSIKALYKDEWEGIIGNCDTLLFLGGGNEPTSLEFMSKLLGKETVHTRTRGRTKGRSGSSSVNFQQTGRDLMTPDEIRMLPTNDALLFIRGEKPVRDKKYDIKKHPNVRRTADGRAKPYSHTVIDIPNWEIAYTVRTHGYPQTSGVLTTAYMEETGCVYVYFFDNFTPGKLRVLEDKPGQTEVSLKTMETYTASGQTETYTTPYNIFTPSGAQAQYAICSPIMDEYGTIYFKNDSAYLMAVGSTIERIEVTKLPDKTTYNVKDTFDPTGMQVTAYYANGMTRDVTKYVTWSDKPLKASDTDFQITFPYAMYQNRENSDTLEMEYGVHCDKPMTTLTLTIADQSAVKYGDVNADGIIDVSDAMLICQIYLGNVTPTDTQKKAADVNGDGTMDVSDAMMVCQYYLGNITKFPVEQ